MTSTPDCWTGALDRDVRANPAYRLRSLESLPAAYRESLESVGVDRATIFGLLVADDARFADKVVDAAGAELFRLLRRPGRLPSEAAGRLAELVLDGVLEIECADGFVSGPRAYEEIAADCESLPALDRLGRLSRAAVEHAERLRLPEVGATTARLYFYNRVPHSPRWARAYPDPSAVQDRLSCPALARHWRGGASDGGDPEWLWWVRRGDRGRVDEMLYKLYVSPAVDALPDVLPVLVDALTSAGARRFKVGPDAFGLLRPDKIVVHMADAGELEQIACGLASALDGVRPHGVPFTAEMAGDGLLSWGGDPRPEAGPVGEGIESWRVSVARRLAEYLAAAQAADLRRTRPAAYALARLAIDGVDTRSFAPAGLDPPTRIDAVAVQS